MSKACTRNVRRFEGTGSMPFGYWLVLLLKGEDVRTVARLASERRLEAAAAAVAPA